MGNLFSMGTSIFKLRRTGLVRVFALHWFAAAGLLVLSAGTINCKSTQTIGGGVAKAQVIKDRTAKAWAILKDSNLTAKEKSEIKTYFDENDKGADALGASADHNQEIAEKVKVENVDLKKDSTTLHWIYGIAIIAGVLGLSIFVARKIP